MARPKKVRDDNPATQTRIKRGPGQPEKKIDLKQLEQLCQLQCTQEEIAAFFGVSRKTIERRLQDDDFREIYEAGRLKGLISLRRVQFQAAMAGNTALQIFLGKNLLKQRDRFPDEFEEPKVIERVEYKWVDDPEQEQQTAAAPKTVDIVAEPASPAHQVIKVQ